jgi:two-component system OmpR family sensor kinase
MHEISEWWNRISLRTKITGVTVFLLTVGLLVAGTGTMAVLRNYLLDEVDTSIGAAGDKLQLQGTIKLGGTAGNPECSLPTLPNDYYLAVLDYDGEVICNNRVLDAARPDVSSLNLQTVAGTQTSAR